MRVASVITGLSVDASRPGGRGFAGASGAGGTGNGT